MVLIGTQDTYLENTKRLLLRHRSFQNLWVYCTAKTVFRHRLWLCADHWDDELCCLVDIARVNLKIHGSTRNQQQSTSNPRPVCPLLYIASRPHFRLSGGSLAGNKGSLAAWEPSLQCAFSTGKLSEFHMGTLASWLCVASGLCCSEESEQALDEIQHDIHHNSAGSLWIDMLVQGVLGQGAEQHWQQRGQGVCLVITDPSGSSRERSSTSWSGQMRNCAVLCKAASKPWVIWIHLSMSPDIERTGLDAVGRQIEPYCLLGYLHEPLWYGLCRSVSWDAVPGSVP